jgi:hypothetical protein
VIDRLDLDARMTRFLVDEAPSRAPERLIHATRDRVAATPQRRGSWLSWRVPRTAAGRMLTAGGLLAVGLIATALALSSRSGSSIASTPSPSPATTAAPSPSAPTVGSG